MDYCIRVKELRIKNNKTQKELATFLGTSQQAYMKYEKGVNEMPVKRIIQLCEYYNVSADYILGFIDEPKTLK